MAYAYLPLFTGDYLKKTRTFTPTQHGVYLLLLMHQWDTNDGIPLDEGECAAICNCRQEQDYAALRWVLERHFPVINGKRLNPRMQEVIERSEAILHLRSKAAQARWAKEHANAMQVHSMSNADAMHMQQVRSGQVIPTSTQDIPDQKEPRLEGVKGEPLPPKRVNGARGSRLPSDWQLPEAWRDWAVAAYNIPPQHAVRISLTFRDYWLGKSGQDGSKVDWFATWRNWCRRELEK